MNLRDRAKLDASRIVSADFSAEISITTPGGVSSDPLGLYNDISLTFDPDTGMPVSGRNSTVALALSNFTDGVYPTNIADKTKKPWIVKVDDQTFKVVKSNPDRSMGIITLELETYKDAAPLPD